MCSFPVFDLPFGEKLVEFSRDELRAVVSAEFVGKSPSLEDIREKLIDSVVIDVRYWANFWPLGLQVHADQHVACIGRCPMQFADDVEGQVGPRFCWKMYGFYGWRCGNMSTLTRRDARRAVHDEVVDIVIDTRAPDALTASVFHLLDAAVAFMREL